MNNAIKVSLICGSASDLSLIRPAIELLKEFGIALEAKILSAHRTPRELADYVSELEERGFDIVIAACGKAAHLPGVVAAYCTLPVIGLPLSASLKGLDSLLSMVQMPRGVPVATVGIDSAENAALLAVEILALKSPPLCSKLKEYRARLKEEVLKCTIE